jgi:hypothetical protein
LGFKFKANFFSAGFEAARGKKAITISCGRNNYFLKTGIMFYDFYYVKRKIFLAFGLKK